MIKPLVSQKGLKLDQSISRRHFEGQRLFSAQYNPQANVNSFSTAWPNNLPSNQNEAHNHAILYFRLKYLQEILEKIKHASDFDLFNLCNKRLDFSALLTDQA